MPHVLFAERFAVSPVAAEKAVDGVYDAARCYTVSPTGVPLVELAVADDTTTMTFVETEKPDTDRAWEPRLASVGTSTRMRSDRDHQGAK